MFILPVVLTQLSLFETLFNKKDFYLMFYAFILQIEEKLLKWLDAIQSYLVRTSRDQLSNY